MRGRSLSTGSMTKALRKSTVQLSEATPLMGKPPITIAASYAQPSSGTQASENSAALSASAAPVYPAPSTNVVVKVKSPYQPIPCGKPSNLIGSGCAAGWGVGGGVIGYLCCGPWGIFTTVGTALLGGYCGKETTKGCDPRKKGEVVRMYRG